jgi:hypothetical protein
MEVAPTSEGDVETADHLIEVAKEDGVDAAFEKLAKEEDDNVSTSEAESADSTRSGDEEGESISDKAHENQREDVPETSADPRVNQLEARVDSLTRENLELSKRVERNEEFNKLALEALRLMQELLTEEDEDVEIVKKKKQSLMGLLATLVAKMITAMLAGPEEADKIKVPSGTSERRSIRTDASKTGKTEEDGLVEKKTELQK